jgi:hypothetical protein
MHGIVGLNLIYPVSYHSKTKSTTGDSRTHLPTKAVSGAATWLHMHGHFKTRLFAEAVSGAAT